jgi:hypothetical protein
MLTRTYEAFSVLLGHSCSTVLWNKLYFKPILHRLSFSEFNFKLFEVSAKFFRIDARSLNSTPVMAGSLNKNLAHATRARKYNWFHQAQKNPHGVNHAGFKLA